MGLSIKKVENICNKIETYIQNIADSMLIKKQCTF